MLKKKIALGLLGILFLGCCAMTNYTVAAEYPNVLSTKGTIVEVEEDGFTVKGEGAYPLVKVIVDTKYTNTVKTSAEAEGIYKRDLGLRFGLDRRAVRTGTILVDGANGRPLEKKHFQVGKQVVAYYQGNVTRSYPPQGRGEAVVLVTKENKVGQYFIVDDVEMSADRKYVTVTDNSADLIATISGNACRAYREIKIGTKLLLWSELMTMSLPAKTNATRATILSE